jgi:hypothetical protein
MKWEKASKKCRKTSSAVESCVERSTDHPLGFVLPVRNLRSLKYLTTAQGQPQPWQLTCLYQMSNAKNDSCSLPIAAGIVDTHSSMEQ